MLLRYLYGGAAALVLALLVGLYWQHSEIKTLVVQRDNAEQAAADLHAAAEESEREIERLTKAHEDAEEVALAHLRLNTHLRQQLAGTTQQLADMENRYEEVSQWAAARMPDCVYLWVRTHPPNAALDPDQDRLCGAAAALSGADADATVDWPK